MTTQHYSLASNPDLERLHNAPYRVVIFSASSYGNSGQIFRGFMQANIQSDLPLQHTMHTALGVDRDKIRLVASEILGSEQLPHVVITIGASCTQAYVEVAAEKQVSVPLVYAASAGLGPSLSRSLMPMAPATGVEIVKGDMEKAARFLWQAKPEMKRLLVPYFPGGINGFLDKESTIIKDFFTARGVHVSMLPVYSLAHSYQLVCQQLSNYDTLMLLEGDLAIERHRAFAYECIRHGVTLFACISEGPTFGSVLGYAMDFGEVGEKAFEYAQRIAYDGADPVQLPVITMPDKRVLFGNASLLMHQDLSAEAFDGVDKDLAVSMCQPAEVLSYLKRS